MRNLIFILTLILFVSCEEEPVNGPPYGIEFNPPLWLQGKWRTDIVDIYQQTSSDYWKISNNDLCIISVYPSGNIGTDYCLSTKVDQYFPEPTVTEAITSIEYVLEIKLETSTNSNYDRFVKLTDSTIHYFPSTTGAFNRIYYRVDSIPQ